MIDLHCHMPPGIDDDARDLQIALRIAELVVADGITTPACTPHLYPGLVENKHGDIRQAVELFRGELKEVGIPLQLAYGADIQVVPELARSLGDGTLPTLHESRYLLFQPPHHVSLQGVSDVLHNARLAGYVPLITHPGRLTYIEADYDKRRHGGARI